MSIPIRVFLVGRHAMMRNALRALIDTEPGMEAVGAASVSAESLEQARLLQPDVIVLDHSTIDDDYLVMVASLMKIIPQPHVLLLTNEMDKREVAAAIEAGVEGYLFKGTAAPEILQAIRALYRGESVFYPFATNNML